MNSSEGEESGDVSDSCVLPEESMADGFQQIQFKDACRQGSPDCASDASQGHMRSPCDSQQQQEEGGAGGIGGTVKSFIYPHPTPVNPSMSSCIHGYCGCVEAPVKACLRLSSDALKHLCSATYSAAARKRAALQFDRDEFGASALRDSCLIGHSPLVAGAASSSRAAEEWQRITDEDMVTLSTFR
ncbi:hypothetical protein Q8A67_023458 [Cirrhinus molitorella]|uniref:Uncharacterized protein n=1 Tax=Cirrhinus molitorella TaxID=172907 RepID=A0AA88P6T8_9TELE|nr:hypothetical protein Q8A67_023458 [Cirrhinus molitorella]